MEFWAGLLVGVILGAILGFILIGILSPGDRFYPDDEWH